MFDQGTTPKRYKISKPTLSLKKPKLQTKKMMKLVLQNKQVCNVKSSKFALNIKHTTAKSPKTWSRFHRKIFGDTEHCDSYFWVLFVAICCNYSPVLSMHHRDSGANWKLHYKKQLVNVTLCFSCFQLVNLVLYGSFHANIWSSNSFRIMNHTAIFHVDAIHIYVTVDV